MRTRTKGKKAVKKTRRAPVKKGGAREGAGRRSLYGAPMNRTVSVFLNAAQSAAMVAFCERRKVSMSYVMREASLAAAGCSELGHGLDSRDVAPGWAQPMDATHLPLKFTEEQHAALTRYCQSREIPLRRFIVEAALSAAGRSDLGKLGELRRITDAVKG